jgi:hypothetical protein
MSGMVNIRFLNEPVAEGRRVNISAGLLPEQSMLDMGHTINLVPGQGQTLDDMLREIEAKPCLAGLVIPTNRTYADTFGYWQAWRTSTIESLGTMYTNICHQRYQHFITTGNEDNRQENLLKDSANRFQGHHRIWEEHRYYIAENINRMETQVRVVNVKRMALAQTLKDRIAALVRQNDQKSVHLTRMLVNTSDAMEQSVMERRRLGQQRFDTDRDQSFAQLQSLVKSLDHFDRAYGRDLASLGQQIQEIYVVIDASVRQKVTANQNLCRQLQARWVQDVYQPLSQLLGDIKPTEALTMAMQALDDSNDPYCLRRCEMVVLELGHERKQLLQLHTEQQQSDRMDEFDDDLMREARQVRDRDRQAADTAHRDRLKALKTTIEDKNKMIGTITQRMQLLQTQAEYLRQNTQSVWTQATSMPVKKVAALVRACDEKQQHIAQELSQRELDLKDLHTEIQTIRTNLTASDRLHEVDMALAVVNLAYDGCRRLYESFQSATSTEAAMKIMLRTHQIDEGRALFTANLSIINKSVDLCRSAFGQIGVTMAQYEDHMQEATRRIHSLDQARIEQEARVTGPEVGAFASLEEYVVTSKEVHALEDQIARMRSMMTISECARDLALQVHQRLINFITDASESDASKSDASGRVGSDGSDKDYRLRD